MALATRIIPTLLCRGHQLVKGERFDSWRSVGVVEQAVRIHQARGVDELILLDIGATPDRRGPDLELIHALSEILFCPLTVGGGIRTVDDMQALFKAGADKIALCTTPTDNPQVIRDAADHFGSQAIVIGIDVEHGSMVRRNCGKEMCGWFAVDWAKEVARLGAGEILLTSIERDGTMQGYDLDLIRKVSSNVDIPVIASGGCKDYEDMHQAIQAGASAVAAGALFQFTDATPRGAAEYLATRGIEVRLCA